jgi:hypothetical protein
VSIKDQIIGRKVLKDIQKHREVNSMTGIEQFVQQAVAQIPWFQNCLLLGSKVLRMSLHARIGKFLTR